MEDHTRRFFVALVLAASVTGCSFDGSGVGASDGWPNTGDAVIDVHRPPPGDGRTDMASLDVTRSDGPRADGMASDTPRPDTLRPDMLQPDTKAVYVDEDFQSGAGALVAKRGTWAVTGGTYQQSDENGNGLWAQVTVPSNDYVIETQVRIDAIQELDELGEGAGISARLQAPGGNSNPVGEYACVVSPDYNKLYLAYPSGANYYIFKETSMSVSMGTWYHLRFTVVGSSLICEAPDQGLSISTKDTRFLTGPPGLVTLYAKASFDDFTVTAP